MSGRGPTERFGFCSGPWRQGWPSSPHLAEAVARPLFCNAVPASSQHALTACPAAPHARRIGVLLAAALAVGPMSGIYATQAMEGRAGAVDAPPGTSAETVVDRMAAQAVASFRERHGLLEDNDFAYAFSSWEEAAENAGHAVADAWSELSQDLEDDALMSLVDRAVAAGAAAPPATQPVVRLSKMMRKRPVAERAPQRRQRPDVSGPVAAELADYLVAAGARRPADLRGDRRQEWVSFLRVLAANKVAAAEEATINKTLKTLRELSQCQQLRGRSDGLGDIDSIDLFAFLQEGTQAPARALAGLRWFVKLSGLPWELGDLRPLGGRDPPRLRLLSQA